MSKIKNGGLDQYGAELVEQWQFGTDGVEGIKFLSEARVRMSWSLFDRGQVNLLEQGELLRQDEFIVWQGRRKCSRRVFLFEDLVLFSKTKKRSSGADCYVYKNCFKVRL